VKKREMFLPLSAIRAMAGADIRFRFFPLFLIFFPSVFPQILSDQA